MWDFMIGIKGGIFGTRHGMHSPSDAAYERLSLQDASYVVFDTELTGLNPRKDSIVSIGAVKIRNGSIVAGETFYRITEPRTELTEKSVVIHGITPSEASKWPGIDRILPEFISFCKDSILVGHMVSIDLRFINREMKRLYGGRIQNPAVDTARIFDWLSRKQEDACAYFEGHAGDKSLAGIAGCYGIGIGEAHDALNDAYVTAQVFQRFLRMLPKYGVLTVADLVQIGRP